MPARIETRLSPDGEWRKSGVLAGGSVVVGRAQFDGAPDAKSISREHFDLRLSADGAQVTVTSMSGSPSHIIHDAEDDHPTRLAKGQAVPLAYGQLVSLSRSQRCQLRVVLDGVAAAPAAADSAVAAPAAARPPSASGAVVVHDLISDDDDDDEGRVTEARAPVTLDLTAAGPSGGERAKRRAARAARAAGGGPAPRRDAASALGAEEVIDLEAANGVGLGASGKPLLPGELEARQQRRPSWVRGQEASTSFPGPLP